MSTSIIKFENTPELLYYCKTDSYPVGLGFDLLNVSESKEKSFIAFLVENPDRFINVFEIPTDIQYEYIIRTDNTIHCQECWYTADSSYHGGGFRHGGTYDLRQWREKMKLQREYSYRRPEAWKQKETMHTA